MIRIVKGELVCECNECDEEFAGGTEDDFYRFIEDLKRHGWRIVKEYDEYMHYCPDCAEDVL